MKTLVTTGSKRLNKNIIPLLAFSAVVSFILMLSAHSDAVPLTIDEYIVQNFENSSLVDTSVLLGTADASYDGTSLTIILTNTSLASTGFDGATNILTGIGFNLPSGMSILGGTVNMSGETAINFIAPLSGDVSGEWGYDNDPITGPFVDIALSTVNTSVATMASSTETAFAPPLFSPPSLDGPEMGLLSGNVSGSTAGGLLAIQDSVVITLNLSGSYSPSLDDLTLIDFINNRDVVLSFGSPDVIPTPEPSALLLFGSGLAGLVLWKMRRFARP